MSCFQRGGQTFWHADNREILPKLKQCMKTLKRRFILSTKNKNFRNLQSSAAKGEDYYEQKKTICVLLTVL